MRKTGLILALLLIPALGLEATELELMTNGEFELPLSEGWEESSAGGEALITRGTGYDHDPDFELFMSKGSGTGHVKIWQAVSVPSTDILFSANLKTSAYGGGGAWCASALILAYLDWNGTELGRTAIASLSSTCPWSDSDTMHIIDTLYGEWQLHEFTLADELANLPGVDPAFIKQVQVTCLISAADC